MFGICATREYGRKRYNKRTVVLKHGSSVVKQWDNLTATGIMNFSDTAGVVSGYTYTMQVTLKINNVSYPVGDITKTCP